MGCIIYARVSTKKQAAGHGVIRQIECCQQVSKTNGEAIHGIYVDVCSGRGSLPQRTAAIEAAKACGCRIYVEAIDRWTRSGNDETLDDDSVDLVFCDESFRLLVEKLNSVFGEAVREAISDAHS